MVLSSQDVNPKIHYIKVITLVSLFMENMRSNLGRAAAAGKGFIGGRFSSSPKGLQPCDAKAKKNITATAKRFLIAY